MVKNLLLILKIITCVWLAIFGFAILLQQYYVGLAFIVISGILLKTRNLKPIWIATSVVLFIVLFSIFLYQVNTRFFIAHQSLPGVPSKVLDK